MTENRLQLLQNRTYPLSSVLMYDLIYERSCWGIGSPNFGCPSIGLYTILRILTICSMGFFYFFIFLKVYKWVLKFASILLKRLALSYFIRDIVKRARLTTSAENEPGFERNLSLIPSASPLNFALVPKVTLVNKDNKESAYSSKFSWLFG